MCYCLWIVSSRNWFELTKPKCCTPRHWCSCFWIGFAWRSEYYIPSWFFWKTVFYRNPFVFLFLWERIYCFYSMFISWSLSLYIFILSEFGVLFNQEIDCFNSFFLRNKSFFLLCGHRGLLISCNFILYPFLYISSSNVVPSLAWKLH